MTWAMSVGLRRFTKFVAAFCSVSTFSSMLALLSSSSDSATGCWRRLKKVRSCFTPSSKTAKSPWSRSVMYRFIPSITVTLRETTSTPARKGAPGRCGGAGSCAEVAVMKHAATQPATNSERLTSGSLPAARWRPAHRDARTRRGDLDLLGLEELFRPAVHGFVLRRQLARELLQRLAETELGEQHLVLAAAGACPHPQHRQPLAIELGGDRQLGDGEC